MSAFLMYSTLKLDADCCLLTPLFLEASCRMGRTSFQTRLELREPCENQGR